MTHSTFILSRSSRWSSLFLWLLWRVRVRSLPSLSHPLCRDTSMLALMFSSRKIVTVYTNFCDICWLDPGFSFVIEAAENVLLAKSTIPDRFLFSPSIACWNLITASNPLDCASIPASYNDALGVLLLTFAKHDKSSALSRVFASAETVCQSRISPRQSRTRSTGDPPCFTACDL